MDLALNHFCNLVLVFAHCRWITVVFADILVDPISLWSKDFRYIITHVTIATTKKQKKNSELPLKHGLEPPLCAQVWRRNGAIGTRNS